MLVPGCMWHVMHWLVGIDLVRTCLIGCPDSFLRDHLVGRLAAAKMPGLRRIRRECTGERSLA